MDEGDDVVAEAVVAEAIDEAVQKPVMSKKRADSLRFCCQASWMSCVNASPAMIQCGLQIE